MAHLTIYQDNFTGYTAVSNRFIDDFMKDANDAQLKVYFYLIRMISANQAVSVSGIADHFNYTEKDIIRALKYWEKLNLLSLDFDSSKSLTAIHLLDMEAPSAAALPSKAENASASDTLPTAEAAPVQEKEKKPEFVNPDYSLDQLKEFKNRAETPQLLFIAESYIGRPLTLSEIKTILFFTDVLHFSEDLIDYLLQYCVDRGKRDFKYIERVAVNWAEEGITSPKQAQRQAGKYDKSVYTIMNELGKNGSPTSREMDFITRWTKEYGFATDIILEACQRTVLATDRHRFEYADRILSSWKSENVHHKADIHKIDELYQKKKTAAKPAVSNKFNQFTQNTYDFDALERELLSN